MMSGDIFMIAYDDVALAATNNGPISWLSRGESFIVIQFDDTFALGLTTQGLIGHIWRTDLTGMRKQR
jgi:hypothetical protein